MRLLNRQSEPSNTGDAPALGRTCHSQNLVPNQTTVRDSPAKASVPVLRMLPDPTYF